MKTLMNELRSTIIRHVEIADRRDIAALTAALCEREIADEIASGDRARPAAAPAKDALKARFQVAGDSVLDLSTGLTWTRGNVGTERLEHKAAAEACAALELAGGGWRLPTLRELLTIVDYERHDPAIDTSVFECKPNYYWTSTPYAPGGDCAWVVNFYGGNVYAYDRYYDGFVRAVRGGQF